MIMERYLTNAMPKSKKFCLKRINRYTGYKYYSLRNYINSDLYTISKDAIYITDDIQLLSNKSKHYIETLIKNIVCPSQYKDNHCIANCLKLFDDSYFTEEEKNFVKQMTNELFLILDKVKFHIEHLSEIYIILIILTVVHSYLQPVKFTTIFCKRKYAQVI